MRRHAAILAALIVAGYAASAFAALGDLQIFYPTRDTKVSNDGGELYGNGGLSPAARLCKWNYSENYISDFDKAAINDWLTTHPLEAGQEYDVEFRWITAGGWNTDPNNAYNQGIWRITMATLNMLPSVDWVEGTGTCPGAAGCPNWNSNPGEAAATASYASQVWTLQNYVPTIDVGNSVQWTLMDGTPLGSYGAPPASLHRYTNSVYLIHDTDDPNVLDTGSEMFLRLDFDPTHAQGVHPMPLFNDFLHEPENKGLTFAWIEKWDPVAQTWGLADENFCLYTDNAKDPPQSNPAQRPYISIEIIETPSPRIPGDVHAPADPGFGCVDGADYTVWADNYNTTGNPTYSNGGWSVGNFTEDDSVDGADYTVWADHYLEGCGGAAVPEPATLLVLLAGAGMAIRRKR